MSNKSESFSKNTFEVLIDFANKNIFKIVLIVGLAFLLLKVVQVLILIFIAFILMAATKPTAIYLNKKAKMPEGLAISIVYIGILLIFGLLIYVVGRPLGDELAKFTSNVPQLSTNLVDWILHIPYVNQFVDVNQLNSFFNQFFKNVIDQFSSIANSLVDLTVNAFRGVVMALFLIIFSIYLFLEREDIKHFIIRFFNIEHEKFNHVYDKIEAQLGAWVRGQLILAFTIGLLTYAGLTLLDVKYALPLAILSAILEIVPIVGPLISGFVITLVGLSISPVLGLFSLILSIVVQQLENNFLVPVIMKRAVGLSPVITIISLLIGQELFGILGAVVSVPLAAMLSVFIATYLDDRDLAAKKSSKSHFAKASLDK